MKGERAASLPCVRSDASKSKVCIFRVKIIKLREEKYKTTGGKIKRKKRVNRRKNPVEGVDILWKEPRNNK